MHHKPDYAHCWQYIPRAARQIYQGRHARRAYTLHRPAWFRSLCAKKYRRCDRIAHAAPPIFSPCSLPRFEQPFVWVLRRAPALRWASSLWCPALRRPPVLCRPALWCPAPRHPTLYRSARPIPIARRRPWVFAQSALLHARYNIAPPSRNDRTARLNTKGGCAPPARFTAERRCRAAEKSRRLQGRLRPCHRSSARPTTPCPTALDTSRCHIRWLADP